MPLVTVDDNVAEERPVEFSVFKLIGPGLIVAATGIGAGDIISATVGGANYGVILLWVVALGAFFKFVLNEGIARFQLATGMTALEGWGAYLPRWIKGVFGIYLIIWTVGVSAALTNACGLGINNITGGAVSTVWGAVVHSVIGGLLVLMGGFTGFEKLMKVLIAAMFFSIVICAIITFGDGARVVSGLVIPSMPIGGGAYVLSLIGGIGGSVTLLSYNYWLREEKMVGARFLRFVRWDLTIAYVFTATFGISIMMIANQAFHLPGIKITNAVAVTRMAEMLGSIVGPAGFYIYSVGFWCAVFASLLGVWQSIPYMFADSYAILRKVPAERREQETSTKSKPYRLGLLFITLVPLPFAFLGQPLPIIITFTIISSLFIPFVAATLLYLNNKVDWKSPVPKNGLLNNALLVLILVLFVLVAAREIAGAVQRFMAA
jgi:Mn2+/Fe2+ NRAMP family transporter